MKQGLSKEDAEKEINHYLQDVGLEDKKNALAATLSGGMKRKLSVIMAFLGDTKVVILDEV
jgi:ABC-type multidrug transport system ATPase subunit